MLPWKTPEGSCWSSVIGPEVEIGRSECACQELGRLGLGRNIRYSREIIRFYSCTEVFQCAL